MTIGHYLDGKRMTAMVFFLHLLTSGSTSKSRTIVSGFTLLTNPYLRFVTLSVDVAGTSLINCARNCAHRYNTCFSFVINDTCDACSLDQPRDGYPNGNEHSVDYNQLFSPLNDENCFIILKYLCEMKVLIP